MVADGWTDVFTNGKIMINNGNNTFSPVTYSINVGGVGDLNNDGLLDVGGAPGQWYENENKWSIKVFMQKQNMQFENRDIIFDYNETGHSLPFTLGFADLFGDEYGEIITADYGGGDPFSDSRLNRIEVFKYDASQGKYIKHFESSDSTAFYEIGMGATSIKAFDFNNGDTLFNPNA